MKTAEEKARELYPDKTGLDVYGVPLQRTQEIKRKAFLDGIEYANKQKRVVKEASDSIPKEVRDRHIKAAYDENERIRKAAEMVVSLYDKDTGDSVVEWTYALRNAIKELEKTLKP